METKYWFYQLKLSAKKPLEEVIVTLEERHRLEVFFEKVFSKDPSLQGKECPSYLLPITGEEAFQLLYEAGFVLASSVSVGGCKATATIEHFFTKKVCV